MPFSDFIWNPSFRQGLYDTMGNLSLDKTAVVRVLLIFFITPNRPQSKQLILSTNVDQKQLETEFLVAICRLTGDKWKSKTLFLAFFDWH